MGVVVNVPVSQNQGINCHQMYVKCRTFKVHSPKRAKRIRLQSTTPKFSVIEACFHSLNVKQKYRSNTSYEN